MCPIPDAGDVFVQNFERAATISDIRISPIAREIDRVHADAAALCVACSGTSSSDFQRALDSAYAVDQTPRSKEIAAKPEDSRCAHGIAPGVRRAHDDCIANATVYVARTARGTPPGARGRAGRRGCGRRPCRGRDAVRSG
jgi:hypothetical protein